MADYKNIKGFNIQYLDSDPPNPIEGQMWFNSTTQTLKGVEAGGAPVGTWASGTSMPTAIKNNAGLVDNKQIVLVQLELLQVKLLEDILMYDSYNGTSWTALCLLSNKCVCFCFSWNIISRWLSILLGGTGTPTLQNVYLII
jgi:hypothetical protein